MGRVAAVVLVALLAASCASSDTAGFGGRVVRRDPAAPTAPGAPTTVAEAPPTFLSYTAGSCPFDLASANGLTVECGTLVVPMRRDKPSAATVKLAVARVRSTSPTPAPDPILYLDGGPGGSALSRIDLWTRPTAAFLAQRDLILLDQRGTGYSQPRLSCEQLSDELYGPAVVRFTEDCTAVYRNQGVDLAAFNTTENAADVADLRKALGIPQWNLFGISYGTRLALWTMQTHPEGVRSVVIDSVYPPGVKGYDTLSHDFFRAVQAVAADCAAQPACDARAPDLVGQLTSAIARLNEGGTGRGDSFARALFQTLYSTEIAPDVPAIIVAANRGDTRTASALMNGAGARARDPGIDENRPPDGAYLRPAMSDGMFHSVECAESVSLSTAASVRAAAGDLPPAIAAPIVDQALRGVAVCSVWHVDQRPLAPVTSPIPTLVLSGTYDPITPPAWGQLAAQTLPNAQFQVVQGSGHGVWFAGECIQTKVVQFFDQPTVAGPDCPGAPPSFAF